MKVLHTADNHLQNNKALLADIVKCAEFMADQAIIEKPDLIAQVGDFWDFYAGPIEVGSPAELAGTAMVKRIRQIAPSVWIRGTNSHDAEHSMDLLNEVGRGYPIYATDRIEQVALIGQAINLGFAPVDIAFNMGSPHCIISCLPSINKSNLMASLSGSVADTNRETIDLIRDILQAWGVVNATARRAGIPTILLFHGTVTGSRLSTGQTMAGKDLELTLGDILLAKADLNLFGHIHMRQTFECAGNVWAGYSGSITRLNHGETEEKGFWIHDNEEHRFIETPARSMRTKRPEGLPTVDTVADVQQGELVRIVYEVSEDDINKVDDEAIRQAALDRGAVEVKIEKVIRPRIRVRAEGISRLGSLEEKFIKWAETTGTGVTRELAEKLTVLETEEFPDEIISLMYSEKQEDIRGESKLAAAYR